MNDRLFSSSWAAVWDDQIRRAVAEVERLDRAIFSDPSLAGSLQKIVEKYSVDVARLTTDPAALVADAFEETRDVDDYGLQRSIRIPRLRVTIPFTGEAEILKVHPSRWTTPTHSAQISGNSITITITDDANADREVKSFCDQVQNNLDVLRQEYERDRPQLEQAVSAAAERRKKEIAAERERDSNRSFTVRRK